MAEECKGCPYWGVVDVDNDENLVWSCTRRNCINITDTSGWMPIENMELKYSGLSFWRFFL